MVTNPLSASGRSDVGSVTTHVDVSVDDGYVAADIEALIVAMHGCGAGRESELMRLLLARVTLDNGFQFQGLCDPDGNLWEANHTALDGAGITRSDIHGKPFWEARWWQSSEAARRQLEAGIRRAATGEFVRYDTVIYGGDSGAQTIVIDFSIRPVRDGHEQTRFLVVEGRDVTEQRRLEEAVEAQRSQLAEMVERLRELDELKSQMFANVSHELRTPLALILGPVQRLRQQLGSVYDRELDLIEGNANLVLKHVTDLLHSAKLESGSMPVAYTHGNLGEWLREWVDLLSGAAEHREIELDVVGQDVALDVDSDHLRRIVTNLVSNAIKFTPPHGRVSVGFGRNGDSAVVTVDDSGPGIAEEQRETAFERFRQLDGGTTRQAGGTGLGLAICRQLATLLRGSISLGNSPLGGLRAVVELPLSAPKGAVVGVAPIRTAGPLSPTSLDAAAVTTTAAIPEVVRRLDHPGAGTVLVCEDNPQLRNFLTEVIGERYNVVAVADGVLGLRHIREDAPDVVVTDIMMPGLGGDQLIAELKNDATLSGLPVLVLSARADAELREQLLHGGAADYLHKPFGRGELMARVENLMTMHTYAAALEQEVTQRVSELAHVEERTALQLNDTVVKNVFAATLDMESAVRLTTQPDVRERLQKAIGELDSAIRQIMSAAFEHKARQEIR